MTNTKIYIKESYTWEDSRRRVLRALGVHHNSINHSIFLNFGEDYTNNDTDKIILNRNIERMRDKIKMNQLFSKFDIPHPKTYYYPFLDLPKTKEDCVVKRRLGECGRGLEFTTFRKINRKYLNKNSYVQAYIPFKREYRVVVDFAGVIGIKEKTGKAKCKSYHNSKWEEIENQKLADFAIKICKDFEIDFAGLDIGEFWRKYYVIEINSAPGISKKWAGIFAEHLIKLGEESVRMEKQE